MASLNSHEPVSPQSAAPPAPAGITEQQLRWREALVLWLRWNEAYEHVTARMYQPGQDAQQLELLMDQMDQIRSQAIRLSQELLD
jgi:hypothetical protein